MKKVISARDIEDLIRSGGDTSSIPADALITPSARDLLKGIKRGSASSRGLSKPTGQAAGSAGAGLRLKRSLGLSGRRGRER